MEPTDLSPKKEMLPDNFPATIPSEAIALRKAQSMVETLHCVVKESSAGYWYERGNISKAAENWVEAAYAFDRCVKVEPAHWRGALQLSVALIYNGQGIGSEIPFYSVLNNPRMSFKDFVDELKHCEWEKFFSLWNGWDWNSPDSFNSCLIQILMDEILCSEEDSDQELYFNHFMSLFMDGTNEFYNEVTSKNKCLYYFLNAKSLLKLNWYDNSIKNFTNAIKLNPSHGWAYFERASLTLNALDALSDYNRCVELDSNNLEAYFQQGLLRIKLHDIEGALESFGQVIKINPRHLLAYNQRGRIMMTKKNYDSALNDFETSISIDANSIHNLTAYVEGAKIKFEVVGDYLSSMDWYSRGILIFPASSELHQGRSKLKWKLGDLEGSEADLQTAETIIKAEDQDYCDEQIRRFGWYIPGGY